MQASSAGAYAVELLFDEAPALDRDAVCRSMRKYCGSIEMAQAAEGGNLILFYHLDHEIEYSDGKVPAQSIIAFPEEGKARTDLTEAIGQSWSWPEAKSAAACKGSLLVSELMSRGLDYPTRVRLFRGALRAVLENVDCRAIHWQPTQQIVDPRAFLEAQQEDDIQNHLRGFINVRLFRIEGADDVLMDTLGLTALGLPDLQCHFHGLDPNAVAGMLWNTSFYLFENGDVIEDGHTVGGVHPQDRWTCRHEESLVGPTREVLDVNPGEPFAAGNRD
ncbi:MAG: DUF4261 domain-containing protein [Planctomycetes bacterium]|nr:DUF4261 domain-containing protein [Planctomycetota bacterium]